MNYESVDLKKHDALKTVHTKTATAFPQKKRKSKLKMSLEFYCSSIAFYCQSKLSIDNVMREMTYAAITTSLYIYLIYSKQLFPLKGLGILILMILALATAWNLFKAAIYSLTPGVICLVAGLVFSSSPLKAICAQFLPGESVSYLIGYGAFLIAISLMRANES